ncbi:MAG: redoxin domain-containing protein [Acidobacteriota bacterium]
MLLSRAARGASGESARRRLGLSGLALLVGLVAGLSLDRAFAKDERSSHVALQRAEGGTTTLSKLAQDGGPIAVIVIKGAWCRTCVVQIASLKEKIAEVQATGGQVVVLSGDRRRENRQLQRALRLPFPVLGDPHGDLLEPLGMYPDGARHPAPGLIFVDRCGSIDLVRPGRSPSVSQDQLILGELERLAASACGGVA